LSPEPPAPESRRGVIASALLLGSATGLRSQMGLAAVVLGVDQEYLPRLLRGRRRGRSVVLGAVGELVVDKLPWTPSRLRPPALVARVLTAAFGAAVLARARGRHGTTAVLSALGAGGAALGSARLGHDVRARLAEGRPDAVVAVNEDLLALALAFVAVAPDARRRRAR